MQINSEPTRRQLMDQVKQQADEIKRLREALWQIMMAYPEYSFARVFAHDALQQKETE